MKVCLVAESYPPSVGGIAVATQKLAEGLAAIGARCVVVTTRSNLQTPHFEEVGNLKVVRILSPRFLLRWWFTVAALPSLLGHGRRCDIIQGSTYGAVLPALVASVLLSKKRVLLVHEFMGPLWRKLEPNPVRGAFYRIAERLMARLPFHRFIAVSEYTKSTLVKMGIPDDKVRVVYHGIGAEPGMSGPDRTQLRADLGFSDRDFVFLTYGRTGVSKGFEYLVTAIPIILRSVPNARFVLILTKYDRRVWRRVLDGLQMVPRSRYRLLPTVSREKLLNYISAADCVVIPSLSEGFALTALEACSLGKRVVATSAGALPEVVFGKHVFVEPGSVQGLAEGCVKAYRGELYDIPRKEFTWEEAVRQYTAVYESIVPR